MPMSDSFASIGKTIVTTLRIEQPEIGISYLGLLK